MVNNNGQDNGITFHRFKLSIHTDNIRKWKYKEWIMLLFVDEDFNIQ
jgi:hypothetical protein